MKSIASRLAIFALCLFFAAGLQAQGAGVRVVLKGHDPVAYFTEGKPVKGDSRYSYDFDEARYYFASERHRAMFAADPDRYAPQFGGYCTGSMSRNARNEGDPEAWVIHDGKLYVFGEKKWKEVAEKDPSFIPTRVPAATKNYRRKG